MQYPKFHNQEFYLGITALSAGVGEFLNDYQKSLENLSKNNFKFKETASVRNKGDASNTPKNRVSELIKLLEDNEVDFIMCATGGEFLLEILPFINLNKFKENVKWLMGASDPTSLLYLITTALDIATIYGFNACSFDHEKLHKSQNNALEIIKGNLIKQNSFDYYEKSRPKNAISYNLTEKIYWENLNGDFDITGRVIGGCLDCLSYLPGTRFDYTKKFIEKYKEDGIIWYFDVFSLTTENFYLALFQLKESGWFNYIKGVIIGRIKFPGGFTMLTYQEALIKIFGNIPIVFNADIGHVAPKMTIINGCIAHIISKNKKGSIELKMEE